LRLGGAVNAIGGFFIDVESEFATTGFDIGSNGSIEVAFTAPQANTSQEFLGFTTDMPLTSLTLSLGSATDGVALDDFQFNVVPEPSTLLLLGFGLVGLGFFRRRKETA
jgi:hypothetical protein